MNPTNRLGRAHLLLLDLHRRRAAANLGLLQALGRLDAKRRQLDRNTAAEWVAEIEAERDRLARELHDTASQLLAGIVLQLDLAGRRLDTPNADVAGCLARARQLAAQTLDEIRRVSHRLHPPDWREHDLRSAIPFMIAGLGLPETVDVDLGDIPAEANVSPEVQTVLYRALQEGLTNVLRHADARRVTIRVLASSDGLTLIVEDDGRGFDVDAAHAAPSGIGLAGIRRRVESVGGSVEVASRPGRGCRLTVLVPDSRGGP